MCLSLKCRRRSQGSPCRCVRFSARKGYDGFNRTEKVTVREDLIEDLIKATLARTCDMCGHHIHHLNTETMRLTYRGPTTPLLIRKALDIFIVQGEKKEFYTSL